MRPCRLRPLFYPDRSDQDRTVDARLYSYSQQRKMVIDARGWCCVRRTGIVSEFCETEEFVASCPADEMIVMQSAHFGRMRLGRCLTVNNGNLGCQLDVLDQLDPLCSGRRRCSVVVATINHRALPCTREVRGYLEASYVCVKGSLNNATLFN